MAVHKDSFKKKGLRYLEDIESTINFLFGLKGHYTRKRVQWHLKKIRFDVRNAITLINKKVDITDLNEISQQIKDLEVSIKK